jgi:hypothetical protein
VGNVVHSVASGAQNINALFFMLGWDWYGFHKNAPGHVTPNLCFCIWWDVYVMQCIPVRPSHEMLTHNFSCSGGTGTDSTKSAPGHITMNLCFCVW